MLQTERFKIKVKRILRRVRKLLPAAIESYAYFLEKGTEVTLSETPYQISEFDADHKSKIKSVDRRLKGNTKCFRIYINKNIAHVTWVYEKLLLTKQLGEKNVLTVGGSLTEEYYRNKGLFTQVLRLIISRTKHDLIMLVHPENISSVKAIENAGFKKKYRFVIVRVAGIKIWCKKYAD